MEGDRSAEGGGRRGKFVYGDWQCLSLDKLVREGGFGELVSQMNVLERVVAALVFAHKVGSGANASGFASGDILSVPIGGSVMAMAKWFWRGGTKVGKKENMATRWERTPIWQQSGEEG